MENINHSKNYYEVLTETVTGYGRNIAIKKILYHHI